MKLTLLLSIVACLISELAHPQINEDFSDGNLSTNPLWFGDTLKFRIYNGILYSNSGTVNDNFYISTPIDSIYPEFYFHILLPFKTSSANYCEFYLNATDQNLTAADSALILRIGGKDDDIKLIFRAKATETVLLDGQNQITEYGNLHFKILANTQNKLRIYYSTDSLQYNLLASIDSVLIHPKHIGWKITQSTSSFFGLHQLHYVYAGALRKDTIPPHIDSIIVLNRNKFKLHFNEAVVASTSMELTVDGTKAQLDSATFRLWHLSTALLKNGHHQFFISGLSDTSGNLLSDTLINVYVIFADTPGLSELVINEILFNPQPGGDDFIELYNVSEKTFNLRMLSLARYTDTIEQEVAICTIDCFIMPGSYHIICRDSNTILDFYRCKPGAFIHCKIPGMNNDEGKLLLRYNGYTIDSVSYSEDMHLSLLSDNEGVSLERLDPQISGSSKQNWFSAAETVGYASPGFINSQRINKIEYAQFELETTLISPNHDGYSDKLICHYQLPTEGFILSAMAYNLQGQQVHIIENASSVGTTGFILWDLVTDKGQALPFGQYILLIEAFNKDGKVLRKKFAFTVASQ